MKTSDLFVSGVIVNEHGEPIIGLPISNIAIVSKVEIQRKIKIVKFESSGCNKMILTCIYE